LHLLCHLIELSTGKIATFFSIVTVQLRNNGPGLLFPIPC
jgi:hypothetical protein